MIPTESTSTFARAVEAIKDLPAWLITAFAVAAGLLLFVPQINGELPKEFRPWLTICVVLFGVLALFKWLNLALNAWRVGRADAKSRNTFFMTPIAQHCRWSIAKQADGSMITQIVADFAVKNRSDAPIGLMRARLISPRISGEVLHDMITVREQRGHMHGTA